MAEFEVHPGPDPGPPRPEFPADQLEAVGKAVREKPGRTAAGIAVAVRQMLAVPGKPPPKLLSRSRMLAMLGVLEQRGQVSRRRGQAVVVFYPVRQEGTDE